MKAFAQKVVNALRFCSDEYVADKIETKLGPTEKPLANGISKQIDELRADFGGKPIELVTTTAFKVKIVAIQSEIIKLDFQNSRNRSRFRIE